MDCKTGQTVEKLYDVGKVHVVFNDDVTIGLNERKSNE